MRESTVASLKSFNPIQRQKTRADTAGTTLESHTRTRSIKKCKYMCAHIDLRPADQFIISMELCVPRGSFYA